MYRNTGTGIGEPIKVVTGIRDPVAIHIDENYRSSISEDRAGARLFLTLLEGKVLRFDMSAIIGAIANLPIALAPNAAHYDEYEALGVLTVIDAPSKARFGDLCAIPAFSVDEGASNVVAWKQRRVFVVDSNQHYLYAATEWKSGARPDITIDINSGYDTPRAILMPVSVSTKLRGNIATSVELYIAEYLGKIWKVSVLLDDTSGNIDFTYFAQNAPTIVLDQSTFTSSIRIRHETEIAKSAGNPIYERVFLMPSNRLAFLSILILLLLACK